MYLFGLIRLVLGMEQTKKMWGIFIIPKIRKTTNFRKLVIIGTIFLFILSTITFSVISLKIDKHLNNDLNQKTSENRIISIPIISNKTIQTINSLDLDIINVNE